MKSLRTVDWTHYIQRESVLYLFIVNPFNHHQKLKEVTGYGLSHQLYIYEKPKGIFYMSAKELKESEIHLFSLIKEDSKNVLAWSKEGERYNQIARNFLKKKTENYAEAAELFENVLFYGTILPFRVLAALDRAKSNGVDLREFKEIQRAFESLRSKSIYPHLLDDVFPHFWKAASNKLAVDWHLCSAMTNAEMYDLIERNKLPNIRELKQRSEWCAIWEENGTTKFSYDRDLPLKLGIEKQIHTPDGELRGRTAYPGHVRGRVCIINKMEHSKQFKEGDILVSINTNPSLTPIIKKCSAIVTDEGGMGCHAAIIAREFKIPCVVGTGHATRAFKDGDIVEVDATNGIIKKLN